MPAADTPSSSAPPSAVAPPSAATTTSLAQDTREPQQASRSDSENNSRDGESEEPDPSSDEDWSEGDTNTEEEEEADATAESVDSAGEGEEDISINWIEVDLQQKYQQYKVDKTAAASSNAGGDTAVIVMDFSQNLTVPSVSSKPSQWYFCSLINVSVFGIYYENDGMQTNYVYDETVSGKGTDQINSMLQHVIRTTILPSGKKKLVDYANNCSGQNKTNLGIKFLLAQVQMGLFGYLREWTTHFS
ncbi:unnamed protein product [Phytophthora fragariaefolia]|uniref:Unnamed protein product n=1 Tax=Phytophthora fragariaefolia TaxID=1490495 RepID=A0A9W6Y571_9STRA|nr:unnamed protein product [Phytophthora fragariaefolia]